MTDLGQEATGWAFTIAAIVCALGGAIAGMVP
jgi:hypothetical protein